MFYTNVPKIMIICYTVPEIWRTSSIIYFGIFFAFLFPYPYPLNSQKKWKFQKNKQKYRKTWSFHTSVPKIMLICYAVREIWHMTNVIVVFYFGLFFTLLPPNSLQNQNFIQTKKITTRYHHFTHVPKIMIRWCGIPEPWYMTDGRTEKVT